MGNQILSGLIKESRLSTTNNGVKSTNTISKKQKWWASIVLGLLSFIVYSPYLFKLTSNTLRSTGSNVLMHGHGASFTAMVIHTIILILIIRILLW